MFCTHGLGQQIFRDRHRPVVESGRAGDEHPVAVDDGTRIADLSFEGRARADESTSHVCLLSR